MSNEWKPLEDLTDVGWAQANGWEIEVDTTRSGDWEHWEGRNWVAHLNYRGRPAQPAMEQHPRGCRCLSCMTPKQPRKVTVTSECWRLKVTGGLAWQNAGQTMNDDWQRFPAGDVTGEIEQ
jgi:hypothetical protein